MPRKEKSIEEKLAEMTPVDRVLVQSAGFDQVVVIGFDEEGEMSLYSTITNGPEILWAIELAKTQILEMGTPIDD